MAGLARDARDRRGGFGWLGWGGGIGIAALLKGVFDGFGFALASGRPGAARIQFGARGGGRAWRHRGGGRAPGAPVVAGAAAGRPARARRRTGASIRASRSVLGVLLTAGGVAAAHRRIAGGGQGLATAGTARCSLVGFVVLGPVAVRPAAAVLGAPIAALRGVGGRLARDERAAQPAADRGHRVGADGRGGRRHLFTVIGASLKASATQGVDRTLAADLVVDQPGYGGSAGLGRVQPDARGRPGRLPSVDVAAGVEPGQRRCWTATRRPSPRSTRAASAPS